MNGRLLVACAASGAMATGVRAGTPADYARVLPLTLSHPAAQSAWRFELTPEAYAVVQDRQLRDLEVFNADGRAVPLARYAIDPSQAHAVDRPLPVLALPPRPDSGAGADVRLVIERDAAGRLHRIDAGEHAAPAPASARDWLLDAGKDRQPIDRLVLDWSAPTAGVVARFVVDAGDDLEHWRRVGTGTVLALEQDGARLERHAIDVHGVRTNYLRLHREDDGESLAGLAAYARASVAAASAEQRWIDAAIVPPAISAPTTAAPAVRFEYRLPAALPVEAARIDLAGANALASLSLEGRATGGQDWQVLAQATVFRLQAGADTLRNDDLPLHTAREGEWRIQSQVPLAAAPRLSLAWRPDVFVFLAEGPAPYTLAVGSARARRAEYPVGAALASLRSKLGREWQPPLAALGAARDSGGAAALVAPVPWRRWLLWGVLVAGALLVGGFALGLLRGERT